MQYVISAVTYHQGQPWHKKRLDTTELVRLDPLRQLDIGCPSLDSVN